ncbi:MAG TPA: hypothetical protein VLA44_11705, partial [Clostridia bacterium]|nr:hypothetical protein [Clostridia bacterium]
MPLRDESEHPIKSTLAKTPAALITRGTPDLHSVAEIVATLRQHGTTLAASSSGELIVESTALRPVDREMLNNP